MLCHISHVYETGCSLYFTVAAKEAERPARAVAGGQGRRQRRDDRRRRDDHPPPRGRHRPQAVAGPGDRPGRRRRCCARSRPSSTRPAILNPGVLDPVTRPALVHVPVNPPSGGGAAPGPSSRSPGCCATPARASRSPTRPARTPCPTWSPRAVGRGDVVVSVGGDGMLSSLAGAVVAARRRRSRCCRPAAATTSPGCSACPTTPTGRPALLLEGAVRAVDLLSSRPPAGAPALVAGSVYAGVDARAAEIVDRAHWLPRRCSTPTPRSARSRPTARPLPVSRRRHRARATTRRHRRRRELRRTTARACRSPPPPRVDDGVLDVVVIEAASPLRLIRSLPKVYDGAHVASPRSPCCAASGSPSPVGTRPGRARPGRRRRRAAGRAARPRRPPPAVEVRPGALSILR